MKEGQSAVTLVYAFHDTHCSLNIGTAFATAQYSSHLLHTNALPVLDF